MAGRIELSRRHLLMSSGTLVAVAASGVLPALTPSLLTSADASPLIGGPLTADAFLRWIGRRFSFSDGGSAPVSLRLHAVVGVSGDTGSPPADHAFSLIFRGPVPARQGGRVGMLAGPELAPTRLLVVPSGRPRRSGQDWVVTVSREGRRG